VAAELKKAPDVEVEAVKGELGEFSVSVEGRKVVDTSRFWYPWPSAVIHKVRAALAKQES
jgi:hypothetical protein